MENKKTILLVDDEESILFSLQRILELSGNYEILTAENGKEALLRMRRVMPDLIISDIYMPEMDGMELCRHIRENEVTKNMPFIFLTAKSDMMRDGFKAGADDFINKPFSLDEVLAKIEAMFRRIELTKQQASQFKGYINEFSLGKILKLCAQEQISGNVILQQNEQLGRLELRGGDIQKVIFKDLPEDKALDELLKWNAGIFVIRSQGVSLKPAFLHGFRSEKAADKLADPVEVAKDTWWVGYRNPNTLLQVNVFLRRFRDENKVINYLIDPGSPIDLSEISAKISKLIGDLGRIHLYSLNHPDPDICMNAVYIAQANPKAICLTSDENWRLISHYNINPKSVKLINQFKNGQVTLSTGQKLLYIPSPFCHAKGAFLTYDPDTRVLFSGDLFGGISDAGRINQLYAEEADWDGIRAFHQIYMPLNKALRYTIERIRELDPQPLLIAPQHGLFWKGMIMERFLERIYNLDVGADLLRQSKQQAELLTEYAQACNELIAEAAALISMERIAQKIELHPVLLSMGNFKEGRVKEIFNRPAEMFENLTSALILGENTVKANQLKSIALKTAHSRGLPAPHLEWDSEPTLSIAPENLFQNSKDE